MDVEAFVVDGEHDQCVLVGEVVTGEQDGFDSQGKDQIGHVVIPSCCCDVVIVVTLERLSNVF